MTYQSCSDGRKQSITGWSGGRSESESESERDRDRDRDSATQHNAAQRCPRPQAGWIERCAGQAVTDSKNWKER
jgi:hypothetical protein